MNTDNLQLYYQKAVDWLFTNGPTILLALITLIIGIRIINFATKLIRQGMEKSNMDPSLTPFLTSLISWGLKALLFISVASMVGIETTSFVAVIGAAGLAIGLALQGTLANFAGGVLILLFKPFKVGDLIESQGELGTVEEIQIFVTKIVTPQNKLVILPNAKVSNENLTNYTEKRMLRVDLVVGISYDSNIKKAKEILLNAMQNHPKVLKDPAPLVAVSNLGESSVDLAVRPYATPEDYWDVYFDIYEACKLALDEEHITIPFPQRDVHLFQHNS